MAKRLFFSFVYAWLFSLSCYDVGMAPLPDNEEKVTKFVSVGNHFKGVDLLVVIDNSQSMAEEQSLLATNIFALINSLVEPILGSDWSFPQINDLRIAVISSDLGLQYGENGSTDGFPYGLNLPNCTDGEPTGDDGRFWTTMPASVALESGRVACVQGGSQCPVNWVCEQNKCVSPSQAPEPIVCDPLDKSWAETDWRISTSNLSSTTACLSQVGLTGCGLEQPLQAALRALSGHDEQKAFVRNNRLLVVLVIADEDDCSIADRALFNNFKEQPVDQSVDGGPVHDLNNDVCSKPRTNGENPLFPIDWFANRLVELKDNQSLHVLFIGIVGVPLAEDIPCQGSGHLLDECLARPEMQQELQPNGFFKPVCERYQDSTLVTSADPGRRYVELAQSFGGLGYIYSICNEDWSPAVRRISQKIHGALCSVCFPYRLSWQKLTQQEQTTYDCINCGSTDCELALTFEYEPDYSIERHCPESLDVPIEKEQQWIETDAKGNEKIILSCPVTQLLTPLGCELAEEMFSASDKNEISGWYYCEPQQEVSEGLCNDGYDNDSDGLFDCADDQCAHCSQCNSVGTWCGEIPCPFNIELRGAAQSESRGHATISCPHVFQGENNSCASGRARRKNKSIGVWLYLRSHSRTVERPKVYFLLRELFWSLLAPEQQ